MWAGCTSLVAGHGDGWIGSFMEHLLCGLGCIELLLKLEIRSGKYFILALHYWATIHRNSLQIMTMVKNINCTPLFSTRYIIKIIRKIKLNCTMFCGYQYLNHRILLENESFKKTRNSTNHVDITAGDKYACCFRDHVVFCRNSAHR